VTWQDEQDASIIEQRNLNGNHPFEKTNPARDNKFDLVAKIEDKLGIVSSRLWMADKATLEAINNAIPTRSELCDKCGVYARFPGTTWCASCIENLPEVGPIEEVDE